MQIWVGNFYHKGKEKSKNQQIWKKWHKYGRIVLEVGLGYPKETHDNHECISLAPEHYKVTDN